MKRLFLIGVATAFSVLATQNPALANDYDVALAKALFNIRANVKVVPTGKISVPLGQQQVCYQLNRLSDHDQPCRPLWERPIFQNLLFEKHHVFPKNIRKALRFQIIE